MPRRIRIRRRPNGSNYFLVDASFLVNKYLKVTWISDQNEKQRIKACQAWWKEIDAQVNAHRAIVYVPDLCIAEAFKVLSKKNYQDRVFRYAADYKSARDSLRKDIHLPAEEARKQERHIRYHDIDTNRDIVISVDRFFEKLHKDKLSVGIVDLMLLATGKYLLDFYGFTRSNLFIVTIDGHLHKLARSFSDVPVAFNPLRPNDTASRVFTSR